MEQSLTVPPVGLPQVQFPLTSDDVYYIQNQLKEGGFDERPKQLGFVMGAFPGKLVHSLAADTAEGKTLMFLLCALIYHRRGMRSVILTTRVLLVSQILAAAKRLPAFRDIPLLHATGEIAPKERQKQYQTLPAIIVASRETVLNDIESGRWVWDRIGLVGRDEAHHGQGRDAYAKISSHLTAQGVRQLLLSPLLAKDWPSLQWVFYNTGTIEPDVMPQRKSQADIQRKIVYLPEQLARMAEILRAKSARVWGEVNEKWEEVLNRRGLVKPELFAFEPLPGGREESASPVVTWQQREEMLENIEWIKRTAELIGSKEELKAAKDLHSLWGEDGLVAWLWHALTSTGRFNFLEDFAYRWSWHNYPSKVDLPELRGKKREGDRLFEQKVIKNSQVFGVFSALAKGTPYWHLITNRDWRKAHLAAFPEIDIAALSGDVAVARSFFNLALTEIAKSENYGSDHPKLQLLVQILSEHREVLKNGKVIILTETRRHARFISEFINAHLGYLGARAVFAARAGSAAEKQARAEAVVAFRSGVADIIVSTDFLREGVDVPCSMIMIDMVAPGSNPIRGIQGRGRAGREEGLPFVRVFYMATYGTLEPLRLMIASLREGYMRTVLAKHGRTIGPGRIQDGAILPLFEMRAPIK